MGSEAHCGVRYPIVGSRSACKPSDKRMFGARHNVWERTHTRHQGDDISRYNWAQRRRDARPEIAAHVPIGQ
jgi:hypothetical protein